MVTQVNKFEIKNITKFQSEELFGATITRLLSREQLPTVGFDHVRLSRGATLKPHTHSGSEAFVYILEGSTVITLVGHLLRLWLLFRGWKMEVF
jgi:quercetin dioxygenase-like cupin family protein